jgi:RimJ/RimL family protein N-acetyltransferase
MKMLGSKIIETKRLILKPQTMEEQEYLWSVLMIPEVNRLYLTVPRKFRDKLMSWEKQEPFYKADMEHANDSDVFRWSLFLKETGEFIGKYSCQDGPDEETP